MFEYGKMMLLEGELLFISQILLRRASLVCLPVVGRGERRGPADLPPDGVGAQKDPRLPRLLHLRDH